MRGSSYLPSAQLPAQSRDALHAFEASARALHSGAPLGTALDAIAEAAAVVTRADIAIVRTQEGAVDELLAGSIHARSAALVAELRGSRLDPSSLGADELELAPATGPASPPAIARTAELAGADVALLVPILLDDVVAGALELYREGEAFSPLERSLAGIAAAHAGAAIRLARADEQGGDGLALPLELVGDALAAGGDEAEAAEQVVRLTLQATGASEAALWRVDADAPPSLLARHGLEGEDDEEGSEEVRRAVAEHLSVVVPESGDVTLLVGEPPVGALRLRFGEGEFDAERLAPLAALTPRAAVALRRARHAQLLADALSRSRKLIAVVGQAIARLSLQHTVETAVERVSELTGSGRVAIYLREGERLTVAASLGLESFDSKLAERLLELALGPFRARGFVLIEDMTRDPRLGGLGGAVTAAGVRRALFVPLVVHDEVIGALGVFQLRPRPYREGEEGILVALSSQLAVAVQNARLHERTKELGSILERALASERQSARRLRALYEISQSFAETLSLEATLDAVAETMVRLFDVDAAAIHMPDERRELLEAKAVHARSPELGQAVPAVLGEPQPLSALRIRSLLRRGRPVLLGPGDADTSDTHRLLRPFLAKGATAALLPLATPAEVLGVVTLLSLDPAMPLDAETVETAMTVTTSAALAIDNARLYQQQKDFAETMMRSLLPHDLPATPGLEIGHVYASSGRVDVGGDVYDFLPLEGGRLAVVLGDVAGKGIEAAADMAMAKFTFRALARTHPEPSQFLASVNEVVLEEIVLGKFITMIYVVVDPAAREVTCACAGHPPMRVVSPSGEVEPLGGSGLALGIESRQEYPAQRSTLEQGSSIVLYTDGIIEARRDGELYGEARLDELLRSRAHLPAQQLADAILGDCRVFSGSDLADDCAVVVLRLAQ